MIKTIFILNPNGDVIVEKHWRGNSSHSQSAVYWAELLKSSSLAADIPTFLPTSDGVLVHVQRLSLYFLALVETDTLPLFVIEFLSSVGDIFLDYFGELNEHAIKDNFIIVYELLDEMLDYGFPMTMEPNILKALIRPPNMLHRIIDSVTGDHSAAVDLPLNSTSVVPWRRSGVRHALNEVFVDILEEIDCIVSATGLIVNFRVRGTIMVNSLLSGTPDLTMVLRGGHMVTDVSLHPCVRYERYRESGVLSFIPPDGNFKLMTYVVRDNSYFSPPVEVKSFIKYEDDHSGSVSVSVHCRYAPQSQSSSRSTTNVSRGGTLLMKMVGSATGLPSGTTSNNVLEDVVVRIPFPTEVVSVSLSTNFGTVQFDARSGVCEWTIGAVSKDMVPILQGTVDLNPEIPIPLSSPSTLAEFKVPGVAVTGLHVERLDMAPSENYKYFKGLKCLSKASKYETRN